MMNSRKLLLLLTTHATAVVLILASACSDKGSDGGECWVSVDTLFESGHAIASTDDIPSAFTEYQVYVDTTTGVFWDGSTVMELRKSEYVHEFKSRKYWLLYTRNYDDIENIWHDRETLYVDEKGVFVRPLGCL